MLLWFTDEEKELIRAVTGSGGSGPGKLKEYLEGTKNISVTGEEREILEDIAAGISLKISGLTDDELENLIKGM